MASRKFLCRLLTSGNVSRRSSHKYCPASYQQTRYYNGQKVASTSSDGSYIVDVRSDTLTQPTDAMRQAMMTATTQDDIYREDPTVKELEDTTSKMFGMESSLFVPSGTMGNLIVVLCHCDLRGREALFGHMAHLIVYEQGGMAQLGGVMPRTIPNKPDGTFDLDEMEDHIRPWDDPHQPRTALVSVENTHGNCGGKVLPVQFLEQLRARASNHGLPVHMDGARVLNASVALNVEPKEILQHVDSVSVCLSKGIGAPVGSVIGGSGELIEKALRLRKVLGGGWRQPGPLAAAALVALQDYKERLAADHRNARAFAEGLMQHDQKIAHVDVDGVHTNVVMIKLLKPGLMAEQFCDRLAVVTEEEERTCGERVIVRSLAFYRDVTRIIFCHNISADDTQKAIRKVCYVLDELAI